MNRLYDVKVDEKRWKVVKIDNGKDNYDSYKIVDKKNEKIYFFRYIIGLEQVSEDDFLIFRRSSRDDFEISRYKLKSSEFRKIFSEKFTHFHFITDDRILFTYYDNHCAYRCGGIYSIKDNSMLEEADWLKYDAVEIYKDDEDPKQIKIYVEKDIPSFKLGDQKLIFTVDPNTLQPNSDCYSQFTDSFIKVSSKKDIDKIEKRDKKNMEIIAEEMRQKEKDKFQKAKEKVLVRRKESK